MYIFSEAQGIQVLGFFFKKHFTHSCVENLRFFVFFNASINKTQVIFISLFLLIDRNPVKSVEIHVKHCVVLSSCLEAQTILNAMPCVESSHVTTDGIIRSYNTAQQLVTLP